MKHILDTVRSHLDNSKIDVPSAGAAWSVEDGQLRVEMQGGVLGRNIQEHGPSIPCYQLALCFWYEQATGNRLDALLEVVGEVPSTPHGNRGRFMLTELQAVAGERLTVQGLVPWQLPDNPVMNSPLEDRKDNDDGGGQEHKAEVLLTQLETTPMGKLKRQFPLGLFNERKSAATRLFPGNGAQADLWSFDETTKTFNLVELKVGGNATVGIIPESLTYARLLQQFAAHPNAKWSKEWAGAQAIRKAERVVVWLVGEKYHPLVFSQGTSPLAWLNEGPLRDVLEFRVLPVDVGDDGVQWGAFWPG